jgi:hypothetical protein
MSEMNIATVRLLPSARDRRRALGLAIAARRRLDTEPRSLGRAWINGREIGAPQPRFAHLGRSYD